METRVSICPRGVLATFPVLPALPFTRLALRRAAHHRWDTCRSRVFPPSSDRAYARLRSLHAGVPLTLTLMGLSKDRPSTGIAHGVHSRARFRALRGSTSQVLPVFRPRRFDGLVGLLLRGLPGYCTRRRSWGSACFIVWRFALGLHRGRVASRILAPRSCPPKLFSPAIAASFHSRGRVRARAVASHRLHRGPCPLAACFDSPLRVRRRAASRPYSIAGAVSPLPHCWVGGIIASLGLPAFRVLRGRQDDVKERSR